MTPAPQTTLSTQASAATFLLKASGLETPGAVLPNKITLTSDDGKYMVSVPRSTMSDIPIRPGESIVVSLTLVRVVIEAAPPASPILLPGTH